MQPRFSFLRRRAHLRVSPRLCTMCLPGVSRCGRSEPISLNPFPVQMWQRRARQAPVHSDVAAVQMSPGLRAKSRCRCGRGEPTGNHRKYVELGQRFGLGLGREGSSATSNRSSPAGMTITGVLLHAPYCPDCTNVHWCTTHVRARLSRRRLPLAVGDAALRAARAVPGRCEQSVSG